MIWYYNMDDILIEDEPISVVFQVCAHEVGLLDPGSDNNNVEKGAKVEFPFWLANELYLRRAVSITAPTCFGQKTRKEIQADAACLDLRTLSGLYKLDGYTLLTATQVDRVGDRSIGSFLLYTFTDRYKEILSKSHSALVTTVPRFLPRLTKEDLALFETARSSMVAFKKWRVGGSVRENFRPWEEKEDTTLRSCPSTP